MLMSLPPDRRGSCHEKDRVVRRRCADCLIFDSETMPTWLGMPDDKDLPSTFSVEYVRTWKHQP